MNIEVEDILLRNILKRLRRDSNKSISNHYEKTSRRSDRPSYYDSSGLEAY